jgi:L-asparaginase II
MGQAKMGGQGKFSLKRWGKMGKAQEMVELWRGGMLESTHRGHAVLTDETGQVVRAWGDPDRVIFPRSSCKMLQALPLIESGAADAAGLTPEHLAFSCASHQGEARHVGMAGAWLAQLGASESDLRCGAHEPYDRDERDRLIRTGEAPCQLHNNCSGKHSGFVTVTRHLRADPEYVALDHPLQRAVREATEDATGMDSPGYGIDGCSAPNFATSVAGLSRAMAKFAVAREGEGVRASAMARLRDAMRRHPEMVAGEGRSCTELMRAMDGRVTLKTGAEAVFIAILPEQKLGLALKIEDGNSRAAEAVLVGILTSLGVLDPAHPMAAKRLPAPQKNCRGLTTGELRLSEGFV